MRCNSLWKNDCLFLQSIYENAFSHYSKWITFNDNFLVQVGLHQGSALCPLSLIMLLEELCREIRSGSPEEFLYADDLTLVGESLEGFKLRNEYWSQKG